jgi:hypothetical protein
LGYIEVIIIEPFVLVYAIMSFEKSRFVYRCALVVDLLLSIAFIVLSGTVFDQRETFLCKMVELCAIPYFVLATIVPCIAIWMVPKRREHSIFAAFRYRDNRPFLLPAVLVFMTTVLVLLFLIMSLIQFKYSPLGVILLISIVHLAVIVAFYKGMGDDAWQFIRQYTALGNEVNTADTPQQ